MRYILFLSLLLFSCQTKQKRIVAKKKKEPKDELSLFDESQSRVRQSLIKELYTGKLSQSDLCSRIVSRLSPAIAKLRTFAKPEHRKSHLFKFTFIRSSSCYSNKRKFFANVIKAINEHSYKVGVLIPLSGPEKEFGETIMRGVTAASLKKHVPSQNFIVKDTNQQKLGSLLADLVFEDNVSILIAAGNKEWAKKLSKWSKSLLLPSLLITENLDTSDRHPFVFEFTPGHESAAHALAASISKRGIQKISFVRPLSGKSDQISESLQTLLKARGVEITHHLAYQTGDFESMNQVVSEIAGTSIEDRWDDYQMLFEAKQKESMETKQAFREQNVFLEAQPKSEALFIPDNFKVVKDFVNLLKYHGVKSFTLFGTNEWRSSALVTPWEPFMEGSFFVDHLGSYLDLPAGIEYSLERSEYFVSPDSAAHVDLQMMGYYAADTAGNILKSKFIKKRKIAKALRDSEWFTKDQRFRWPQYLFSVQDQGLSISWKMTNALASAPVENINK